MNALRKSPDHHIGVIQVWDTVKICVEYWVCFALAESILTKRNSRQR
jgi:hypothetical protein